MRGVKDGIFTLQGVIAKKIKIQRGKSKLAHIAGG
jgi:hypothetical protein